MKYNYAKYPAMTLGLLSLLYSTSALSQVNPETNGVSPQNSTQVSGGAEAQDDGLQEIVVSARKQTERLADVPVAVGVVDGSNLSRLNLTNFEQLSQHVAGFKVAETASGNRISLRGIGSGTNRGFEQSVGLFSDSIYSGRAIQFSSPFFDIEQVEILRGPQSILFGKNTVAGAVNIITAKPTADKSMQIEGGYGPEYNSFYVGTVANLPATDNLQFRLAYRHDEQNKGFLYNSLTDSTGVKKSGDLARVSMAWQPGGDAEVNAKYEYARTKRFGNSYQIYNLVNPGGNPAGRLATFRAADPDFETNLDLNLSTGMPDEHERYLQSHNGTVHASIPVGDGSLSSDTAYLRYTNAEANEDSDLTPLNLIRFQIDEKYDQFSQELRYSSAKDQMVSYTFGAFYSHSRYRSSPQFVLALGSLGLVDSATRRNFDQKVDTYSAFGEVTIEPLPDFKIISGLRYVAEDKSVVRSNRIYTLSGGMPTQTLETNPVVLARMLAIFNSQNFGPLAQSVKERQFSPAVTLQYNFNPDAMIYAKFTKGSKSGGFDASDQLGTAPTYLPESVRSWEAGVKWDASRKLNVNLTGFVTEFGNLQVQSFNGLSYVTNNAAKARASGIETEVRWRPFTFMTLSGAVNYLDAKYRDYTAATCNSIQSAAFVPTPGQPVCTQDLSGRPFLDASHWSGYLTASVDVPVGSAGWSIRGDGGLNFRSAAYLQSDLHPLSRQSGYSTLDATIELASPDDGMTLALVMKNLTDVRAMSQTQNVPVFNGALGASVIDPRTIEVRAKIRF